MLMFWLNHRTGAVHLARPMPGFYSSPAQLATSIYYVVQAAKLIRQFSGGDQVGHVGHVLLHGAVAIEKIGDLANGAVHVPVA